jgi:Uma2 family endonuclease
MTLREKPQVTAEEFERFIHLPENADRDFELIGGEIVEVVSNNYSSEVAFGLGSEIRVHVRRNRLGRVTGADGGYWVGNERYIPDVGFISIARQPEPCREAYNPNAPDLAVEVLSPSNRPDEMRIKIVNYLRAGTTVWLVDPERKVVEVYSPHAAPQILTEDKTLDGGAALPGFRLPIRDIFAV